MTGAALALFTARMTLQIANGNDNRGWGNDGRTLVPKPRGEMTAQRNDDEAIMTA